MLLVVNGIFVRKSDTVDAISGLDNQATISLISYNRNVRVADIAKINTPLSLQAFLLMDYTNSPLNALSKTDGISASSSISFSDCACLIFAT